MSASSVRSIPSEVFAQSIRRRLFAPGPRELRRVGLEIEMLPLLIESGAPCPLEPHDGEVRSTLRFMREFGASRRWCERRSAKGAPYFTLPNDWSVTFEPGGQVELCTTATPFIGTLLSDVRELIGSLRAAAVDAGIDLAAVGIDPHNSAEAIPLQICSERYEKMTRYFDCIGPSGARMMRQTAATQVSLDGGQDPGSRWRLLSDSAPYLTAMFANSARYAGAETGYRSFRQRCWRLLDPTRTGVPHPELGPCDAYTAFALDAVDMTRVGFAGAYRSFGEWVLEGDWSELQWENHLTTLFPEVRPRGHLEVRSIDALPPELIGAPVVLLAGLIYDPLSSAEARALLPCCDESTLEAAARSALRDAALARTGAALAELGLRGARRLGSKVLSPGEIERTEQFVREYSGRGRSPADDR